MGQDFIPPLVRPSRLVVGDAIRLISPSKSAASLRKDIVALAEEKLRILGFKVTWGAHALDSPDALGSTPPECRVSDLHEAFLDPESKAILATRGGFNSNQLLSHIDWDLLRSNPKIFCSFSDGAVLANAIYAKTGLETYLGALFCDFGYPNAEYLEKSFIEIMCGIGCFEPMFPSVWTEDKWVTTNPNEGPLILQSGFAQGTCIGGNLSSFCLLSGTSYQPVPEQSVLFIEEDFVSEEDVWMFDRNLQSLIHQPFFQGVCGIVIGKFETASAMTKEKIDFIIRSKKQLTGIPVIWNVDFSHTNPRFILPVGRGVRINTSLDNSSFLSFES